MTDRYGEIAFTDTVKSLQEAHGSRRGYARRGASHDVNHGLGPEETAFIAARDSFWLASVSETGWPYVQFRGGPNGFLRVIDDHTLGFADFRGNRQYVTAGNVASDDRVALLLIDFPNRRRLKLFGRMRDAELWNDPQLQMALIVADYDAVVERAFLIAVEAFDWNCPQHIRPRFSESEIRAAFARQHGGGPCGPDPLPNIEE